MTTTTDHRTFEATEHGPSERLVQFTPATGWAAEVTARGPGTIPPSEHSHRVPVIGWALIERRTPAEDPYLSDHLESELLPVLLDRSGTAGVLPLEYLRSMPGGSERPGPPPYVYRVVAVPGR